MAEASPYKTHLGWRNYVGVSLLVHGSDLPVEGTVCDINLGGVAILLRGADAPELYRGDAVTVRLTASWLPRPVVAGATMTGKRRDVEGLVHEFSFTDQKVVDRQITPVLHSVFNRRRAPRVVPGELDDRRIAFQSHADPAPRIAELHQMSSSGMSVLVDRAEDPGTPVGTPVGLSFYLAGRANAMHAVARLRSRRPDGRCNVLGFEFDAEATPDFARFQGAVLGYILSRAPVPVSLFD